MKSLLLKYKMQKKIGAVIVTFNPDISGLFNLVNIISKQFESILIVDNGSTNVFEMHDTLTFDSISFLDLNENLGIAAALNKGIDYYANQGYQWVATFDQDSVPDENFIDNFLALSIESAGVVGSYYIDRNWSDSEVSEYLSNYKEYEETNYVITSGAFVNVEAWAKIGGFDNQLFIDWVDWDLNERMTLAGWKVFRTKKLMMEHQVGEPVRVSHWIRILLWLHNRPVRDHSSFRQYYIFRNRFIFLMRYKNASRFIALMKSVIALREILVLPEKPLKFQAALIGIVDGMKYDIKLDDFFQTFLKEID